MPLQIERSFSRLGKTLLRSLLHKGGGLDGVRRWNRHGYRILMYHRFPADSPGMQESLARQCKYIIQNYTVVSLNDIGRSLQNGEPLPPNALAVTVDDGYRDFIDVHPIFRAYNIPVTVFLVSGFLDQKLWLWWDQLAYLLNNSRLKLLQVQFSPDSPPASFKLETPEQRQAACTVLIELIKQQGNEARRDFFRKLPGLLELDIPASPPEQAAALHWTEARKLMKEGVDFGAHTVTHPILSRILDPLELAQEIEQSKRRIEEELQRPVLHFAYPYGYMRDFNGDTVKLLGRSHFQTAVTTKKGVNDRHTDPFFLKRYGVEAATSESYFKEFLAGLHADR